MRAGEESPTPTGCQCQPHHCSAQRTPPRCPAGASLVPAAPLMTTSMIVAVGKMWGTGLFLFREGWSTLQRWDLLLISAMSPSKLLARTLGSLAGDGNHVYPASKPMSTLPTSRPQSGQHPDLSPECLGPNVALAEVLQAVQPSLHADPRTRVLFHCPWQVRAAQPSQ